MKNLFLLLTFLFLSISTFTQTSEIKIKFIGNCGLYITDGITNIYSDFPYTSGAYKYMKYDKAEIDSIQDNAIFIFTHRHADHYSGKILKKLKGQKFDPFNVDDLEKLNTTIPDFKIQAFETSHKVFGISFKHYSYLITWYGKKIYLSGDTGELEHLKELKDLDWAFMNPWQYMDALREKIKVDAKKIGIYHLYPDQKVDGEIPDYLLILKNQGEIIRIPY